MRIGITSDTHGDTCGWQAAVDGPFAGADLILHAGDIFYHGPRSPLPAGYGPPALAELINHAPAPVIIARGNCDSDVDQLVLDFPIQAPYALAVVDGLRIMVNHGDALGLADSICGAARLAEQYRLDVVVCGHTHAPMLEAAGGALIINPGSPALPKPARGAVEAQPTVGVIEDDVARILTLDGRTLMTAAIIRRDGEGG